MKHPWAGFSKSWPPALLGFRNSPELSWTVIETSGRFVLKRASNTFRNLRKRQFRDIKSISAAFKASFLRFWQKTSKTIDPRGVPRNVIPEVLIPGISHRSGGPAGWFFPVFAGFRRFGVSSLFAESRAGLAVLKNTGKTIRSGCLNLKMNFSMDGEMKTETHVTTDTLLQGEISRRYKHPIVSWKRPCLETRERLWGSCKFRNRFKHRKGSLSQSTVRLSRIMRPFDLVLSAIGGEAFYTYSIPHESEHFYLEIISCWLSRAMSRHGAANSCAPSGLLTAYGHHELYSTSTYHFNTICISLRCSREKQFILLAYARSLRVCSTNSCTTLYRNLRKEVYYSIGGR